jgi:GDP-L-fucose synthase
VKTLPPYLVLQNIMASPLKPIFELRNKTVFVAGHRGMVGSALVRRLASEDCEIVTASRTAVDLTSSSQIEGFLQSCRPDVVVVAAAKVGGILANSTFPADFLGLNLAIALNIITAAHKCMVRKLLFLGSSCIYPREAPQPMPEKMLLTGPLEPTNEWYAVAKIAGIKLCEAYRRQYGDDFISAMPSNLYGPGDNYHPEHSHVPAALIRRIHEAKATSSPSVTIWGTGTPRREFLYVNDLADACVFMLKHYSEIEFANVGTGEDISITDFAVKLAETIGYDGEFEYDTSRPDGMPRKLLDVSKLAALGWKAKTALSSGLQTTYSDFLAHVVPQIEANT